MKGKKNNIVPLVRSTAFPDAPPSFFPVQSETFLFPFDQSFGEALSTKGTEKVLVFDFADGCHASYANK